MNIKDHTEFEAKFYPVNKEGYRKKLTVFGAKLKFPERKMIKFSGNHLVNPNFPRNDYIRVRDEGNLIRLSYKTFVYETGSVSDQKEIDVVVSDFDKTIGILELTGVVFNQKQESLREEWTYKDVEITIDTWPGLPSYSEIEAKSEERVKEIADQLGFDWDKKIITPATHIFSKVYGLSINDAFERMCNLTFENNPFEALSKVWDPKTQRD